MDVLIFKNKKNIIYLWEIAGGGRFKAGIDDIDRGGGGISLVFIAGDNKFLSGERKDWKFGLNSNNLASINSIRQLRSQTNFKSVL